MILMKPGIIGSPQWMSFSASTWWRLLSKIARWQSLMNGVTLLIFWDAGDKPRRTIMYIFSTHNNSTLNHEECRNINHKILGTCYGYGRTHPLNVFVCRGNLLVANWQLPFYASNSMVGISPLLQDSVHHIHQIPFLFHLFYFFLHHHPSEMAKLQYGRLNKKLSITFGFRYIFSK